MPPKFAAAESQLRAALAIFGDGQSVPEMAETLREFALSSRGTYTPPPMCRPDGTKYQPPTRPVIAVGVTGDSGQGKSSWLNTIFGACLKGTTQVTRSGKGPEGAHGTMKCYLLPFHRALWPDEEDPPAYFFIWEPRGLVEGSLDTKDDVAKKALDGLLNGNLALGATTLATVQQNNWRPDMQHTFPSPTAIIWFMTYDKCAQAKTEGPILSMAQQVIREHPTQGRKMIPTPLYLALGSCDAATVTAADVNYDMVANDQRVFDKMAAVQDATGLPFGRIYPLFGLHVLKASGSSSFADPREFAALKLLVDAVREGQNAGKINSDQHMRMSLLGQKEVCSSPEFVNDMPQQARDNVSTGSVLLATPHRVTELLLKAQRPEASDTSKQALVSINKRILELDVDGKMLIDMSDQKIEELFGDIPKSLGAIEVVKRLVAPYRKRCFAEGSTLSSSSLVAKKP